MRMNLDHVASDRFVLGRDVRCEFDYWPLAVSMPPTKVCPQCKAAVPFICYSSCKLQGNGCSRCLMADTAVDGQNGKKLHHLLPELLRY